MSARIWDKDEEKSASVLISRLLLHEKEVRSVHWVDKMKSLPLRPSLIECCMAIIKNSLIRHHLPLS